MKKLSKAEQAKRAEAIEYLKEAIAIADRKIVVLWASGEPTSTGRTDRYIVKALSADGLLSLEHLLHRAGYYRINRDGMVVVTGYNSNKAHNIASTISHLVGHAVHCTGDYTGPVGKSPLADTEKK